MLPAWLQRANVIARPSDLAVARLGGDLPFWLLCLAVLAIPLEFTKRWFGLESVDVSRLCIAAGLLALGVSVLRGHATLRRAPGPLLLGIVAILAVDAISFIATAWPNAVKQVGGAIFYAAFAFFVFQVLRDRYRFAVAAACLVASGIGEAMVMLAEHLGDFNLMTQKVVKGRRSGTFVDPNVATRVLLLGVLGLLALMRSLRQLRLLWPTLGIAVLSLALIPTFSRSGWLLAVLVAALWAIVGYRDPRAWIGAIAVVLCLGIGIAVTPGAVGRATELPPVDVESASVAISGYGSRIAATPLGGQVDGIIDALPLDTIRRYLLRAGLAMFIDHPLTGVGVGGFQPMILGPYQDFIAPDYRSQPTTLPHTDLVRIAAEEGIVGLLAFALLVGGTIMTFRRALTGSGSFERVALTGIAFGLVVITLAAQTEGRFYTEPYLWLLLGALAAVATRGPDWSDEGRRVGVRGLTTKRQAGERARRGA